MRKAINFDIDTKKYERYTGKSSPTAYMEIRSFLKKNGFEHRQGSGYISIENINNSDIVILITNMSLKFEWLKECIKEIDVTNIGKQHSLLDTIKKADIDKDITELEIQD